MGHKANNRPVVWNTKQRLGWEQWEGQRELKRTEWEGQADKVEPAFTAKAKNKR